MSAINTCIVSILNLFSLCSAPTHERPATKNTGGRRGQGGGRPAPGGGRPAPGGGRPAPGGGRPAPGGGRPAPGGGRPAPGGGRPAPGGGRPVPGGNNRGQVSLLIHAVELMIYNYYCCIQHSTDISSVVFTA